MHRQHISLRALARGAAACLFGVALGATPAYAGDGAPSNAPPKAPQPKEKTAVKQTERVIVIDRAEGASGGEVFKLALHRTFKDLSPAERERLEEALRKAMEQGMQRPGRVVRAPTVIVNKGFLRDVHEDMEGESDEEDDGDENDDDDDDNDDDDEDDVDVHVFRDGKGNKRFTHLRKRFPWQGVRPGMWGPMQGLGQLHARVQHLEQANQRLHEELRELRRHFSRMHAPRGGPLLERLERIEDMLRRLLHTTESGGRRVLRRQGRQSHVRPPANTQGADQRDGHSGGVGDQAATLRELMRKSQARLQELEAKRRLLEEEARRREASSEK